LVDELESRVLCGDGAMGTLLLADGIPLERCFEELCVSEPDRIRTIHEQYIGAGARVIETNTFGANAVRLERFGMEHRVVEINHAAAQLAKKAASGKDVYVAGSVGPLGISAEEAAARGIDRAQCFREQISALLEAGVELIFFETFTDFAEMEVAFCAKKELSDVPEICSFSCRLEGRLASGMPLADAFTRLRELGTKIMGANCMNDPRGMVQLLQCVSSEFLLAAYPAAGSPKYSEGRFIYDVATDTLSQSAREMVANGARLIGGCCGTTPAHIAVIANAIADLRPQ
jgi:methionine synthase / methylenetetrahydrofolate reductase(NADPH)